MAQQDSKSRRKRRRASIRKKIAGTAARPRLTVFRSNKHIYAQVIDDTTSRALLAVSDRAGVGGEGEKTARAKRVGEALAKACLAQGIERVVFDRNGYKYHGRVMALATGAREGGLKF